MLTFVAAKSPPSHVFEQVALAAVEESGNIVDTFAGANPDFQIGVKKRRSVSTLSIPRASARPHSLRE